jgi:hypothetical protein
MSRQLGRQAPALVLAAVALVAALAGTVYAAAKINGRTIKVKSLPGNRLAPGSVPANRLKAGTIPGNRLAPGSITGTQIDAATLGKVPQANHADSADSARDSETALNAVNAIDAKRVNGFEAGCREEARPFAGSCWQVKPSEAALKAPDAAASCATQGGELPDALSLAAFSQQAGIVFAAEEWSGDIPSFTGTNAYSVITISSDASIKSALSTEPKKFRCVFPLVS